MRSLPLAICRLCLFLIIFLFLAFAGNFVFVRPDTFARLTLLEMQERNDIETAFVGSSIVRNHFDPELISRETGRKAFNCTIPCLSLQGAIAVTEELYRYNQPDTVILVVEPSMFDNPEEDIEAENILMSYLTSPTSQLRYYLRLVKDDPRYLDRAFLYRTFHARSLSEMLKTATLHINPHSLPATAVNPHDPDGAYVGHGFVEYKTVPCPETLLKTGFRREPVISDYALHPRSKSLLQEYRSLVESHGSQLLILIFPNFSTSFLAYPSYIGYNTSLEQYCREQNITCINLSLARPELFSNLDAYFFDPYHMNRDGARFFSSGVARVLNLLSAGEDINNLFYSDKWSFLLAHDTVPNVWIDRYEKGTWNYSWEQDSSLLDALPEDTPVYLANANHIQGTVPEYRFVLTGPEEEVPLTDWSTDGIIILSRPLPTDHSLRVYARAQNHPEQAVVWNDWPASSK